MRRRKREGREERGEGREGGGRAETSAHLGRVRRRENNLDDVGRAVAQGREAQVSLENA